MRICDTRSDINLTLSKMTCVSSLPYKEWNLARCRYKTRTKRIYFDVNTIPRMTANKKSHNIKPLLPLARILLFDISIAITPSSPSISMHDDDHDYIYSKSSFLGWKNEVGGGVGLISVYANWVKRQMLFRCIYEVVSWIEMSLRHCVWHKCNIW